MRRTAAAWTCRPGRRGGSRVARSAVAARSRSASSQTIVAAMLPSSSAIGPQTRRALQTACPTWVLPVNVEEPDVGVRHQPARRPRAPGPCTRFTWPAASRASSRISTRSAALSGVACGGLITTVLPDGQRGRDLVRHHVQRRVERRDPADDAARHADRERHPMRMSRAPPSIGTISPARRLRFLGRDDEGLERRARPRCPRRRPGSRPRRRSARAKLARARRRSGRYGRAGFVALAGRRAARSRTSDAPRPRRHRPAPATRAAPRRSAAPVNLSSTGSAATPSSHRPPISSRAFHPPRFAWL